MHWYSLRLVTLLSFVLLASEAIAQSGSSTQPRYAPPAQPAAGSGTAEGSGSGHSAPAAPASPASRPKKLPVALRGYCPVCLLESHQWVPGNQQIAMPYDGKLYLFPDRQRLEMFQKNRAKYTPMLGGDDAVHFDQTGQRVAGSLQFGTVHNGQMFFFASEKNRKTFNAQSKTYEKADLAMEGTCIVCQVDGQKRIPGLPEFTLLHNGLRYQFASKSQLQSFSANPVHYTQAANSATQPGSSTTAPAQGGSGGYLPTPRPSYSPSPSRSPRATPRSGSGSGHR